MIHNATRIAHDSNFRRARVGACIVRGSRILSTGVNRIGYTHFLPNRRFPESVHAEQQAIVALLKSRRQKDLVGSTLYVSRINNHGSPRCARPCADCQRIIEAAGIRRVFYTTNTGVEQL